MLKDACAWRPTFYERETDISTSKCSKVLQALDRGQKKVLSKHTPAGCYLKRSFNDGTIAELWAGLRTSASDVEGPRTSNSYHHRFRKSREGNNITGSQLRARSKEEGLIDKCYVVEVATVVKTSPQQEGSQRNIYLIIFLFSLLLSDLLPGFSSTNPSGSQKARELDDTIHRSQGMDQGIEVHKIMGADVK